LTHFRLPQIFDFFAGQTRYVGNVFDGYLDFEQVFGNGGFASCPAFGKPFSSPSVIPAFQPSALAPFILAA
jgi:hypothetical protein